VPSGSVVKPVTRDSIRSAAWPVRYSSSVRGLWGSYYSCGLSVIDLNRKLFTSLKSQGYPQVLYGSSKYEGQPPDCTIGSV